MLVITVVHPSSWPGALSPNMDWKSSSNAGETFRYGGRLSGRAMTKFVSPVSIDVLGLAPVVVLIQSKIVQ